MNATPALGPYGPVAPVTGCGAEDLAATPYRLLSLPPFYVTKEPEVTAYAAVELTFELTGTAGATPAPSPVR